MLQEEARKTGERLLRSMEWVVPEVEPATALNLHGAVGGDTALVLYRVKGLGASEPSELRSAMTNVLSAVAHSTATFIYVLTGKRDSFTIHIGVSMDSPIDVLKPEADKLRASITGNLMGALLSENHDASIELGYVNAGIDKCQHFGMFTGIPTLNQAQQGGEKADFQGIERLANSLAGEEWQFIISAHAPKDQSVQKIIDEIHDLSTELSLYLKQSFQQGANSSTQKTVGDNISDSVSTGKSRTEQSGTSGDSKSVGDTAGTNKTVGTSTSEASSDGSSWSLTHERTDRRASEWHKHLSETTLERFRLGASKGMFITSMHIGAKRRSVYDRLASGVVSIFQGDKSTMTPLKSHYLFSRKDLPDGKALSLSNFAQLSCSGCGQLPRAYFVAHSMPLIARSQYAVGSWLNANELAFVAALPAIELPGVPVRKTVDFGLNTDSVGDGGIVLGHIKQQGRNLPATVALPHKALSSHVFVTGVTGSGKTTTCMKLLLESGLNFMVIEPAKTEYRALHAHFSNSGEARKIEYYSLSREDLTVFRLNPFEVISPEVNLTSHIQVLTGTLTAVFPMEASMPYMVEEAIIGAYEDRGWDIHSGVNFLVSDPWGDEADVWPTFSDMIKCLRIVIRSKGLGKEFEEKYEGSLVSRLSNLTRGTKGRMLNCRRSINFDALLDRCVVIELDELKDEKDKALIMGLLLTRLVDAVKLRHRNDSRFQHVTLLEEAHRLLSKPEPGEGDARKHGVEMFANMLAEVRKYGAGLIVADQIPGKLVPDVIKNTNMKIVHRLFSADDRTIMGDSMGLSDEQKNFLPMLQPGETVIYRGGWHEAVWTQIGELVKTDADEVGEQEIRNYGASQFSRESSRLAPALMKFVASQSEGEALEIYGQAMIITTALTRFCNTYEAIASRNKAALKLQPIHGYIKSDIHLLATRYGQSDSWAIACVVASMIDAEITKKCNREYVYELLNMMLENSDSAILISEIIKNGAVGDVVLEIGKFAKEK